MLPAVIPLPATATLPAVAADPTTAIEPAVAAEPATAMIPAVAADPTTASEPATVRESFIRGIPRESLIAPFYFFGRRIVGPDESVPLPGTPN